MVVIGERIKRKNMVLYQDENLLQSLRNQLEEEKSSNSILEQELEEWAETIRRQGREQEEQQSQKAAAAIQAAVEIQLQQRQQLEAVKNMTPATNTSSVGRGDLHEHLKRLEEQLNQYQDRELELSHKLQDAQEQAEHSRLELQVSKEQVEYYQQELEVQTRSGTSEVPDAIGLDAEEAGEEDYIEGYGYVEPEEGGDPTPHDGGGHNGGKEYSGDGRYDDQDAYVEGDYESGGQEKGADEDYSGEYYEGQEGERNYESEYYEGQGAEGAEDHGVYGEDEEADQNYPEQGAYGEEDDYQEGGEEHYPQEEGDGEYYQDEKGRYYQDGGYQEEGEYGEYYQERDDEDEDYDYDEGQDQYQDQTEVIELLRSQRTHLQDRIVTLIEDNCKILKDRTKYKFENQSQERRIEELETQLDCIHEDNQFSDVLLQRQISEWKLKFEQLSQDYKELQSSSQEKENYFFVERKSNMAKIEQLEQTNRSLKEQHSKDQRNWEHERSLHKSIVEALQSELDGGCVEETENVVSRGGMNPVAVQPLAASIRSSNAKHVPFDPLEGKVIDAPTAHTPTGVSLTSVVDGSHTSDYPSTVGAVHSAYSGNSERRKYHRRMSNDTISEDSVGLFDGDYQPQGQQLPPIDQRMNRRPSTGNGSIYSSNQKSKYRMLQERLALAEEELKSSQTREEALVLQLAEWRKKVKTANDHADEAQMRVEVLQAYVDASGGGGEVVGRGSGSMQSSSSSLSPEPAKQGSSARHQRMMARVRQYQESAQRPMIDQGTQRDNVTDSHFDVEEERAEDDLLSTGSPQAQSDSSDSVSVSEPSSSSSNCSCDIAECSNSDEGKNEVGDSVATDVSFRMVELTRQNQEKVRLLREKRDCGEAGVDHDDSAGASKKNRGATAYDDGGHSFSASSSSNRGGRREAVFVGDINDSGQQYGSDGELEEQEESGFDSSSCTSASSRDDEISDEKRRNLIPKQYQRHPMIVSSDEEEGTFAYGSSDDNKVEVLAAELSDAETGIPNASRSICLGAVASTTTLSQDESISRDKAVGAREVVSMLQSTAGSSTREPEQQEVSAKDVPQDKESQSTSVVSWLLSKATGSTPPANQGEEKLYYQTLYENEKASKRELLEEIRSLKAEVSSIEHSNRSLLDVRDSAMRRLGMELEEREKVIQELEAKRALDEIEFEAQIEELQNHQPAAHAALSPTPHEEVAQLKSEIYTLSAENDVFAAENNKLKSKIENMSETVSEKQTRMEVLLKLLSDITEVTMCDQVEHSTGEQKLQELLGQLAAELDKANSSQGESEQSEDSEVDSSSSDGGDFDNHSTEAGRKDSQGLRSIPLDAKDYETSSLHREIRDLKSTVVDLSRQLEHSIESERHANQEVEKFLTEKDGLVSDLQNLEAEHQESLVSHGIRVSGLNERVLELDSELADVKEKLEKSFSEVKRLNAERDSLAARLSEISIELAEALGRENALVKDVEGSRGVVQLDQLSHLSENGIDNLQQVLMQEDIQYLEKSDFSDRLNSRGATLAGATEGEDSVGMKHRISELEDDNVRLREANAILDNESICQRKKIESAQLEFSELEKTLLGIESDAQKMKLAHTALKSEKERLDSERVGSAAADRSLSDENPRPPALETNLSSSNTNAQSLASELKRILVGSEQLEEALLLAEDAEFLFLDFSSKLSFTLNDHYQEIRRLATQLDASNKVKHTAGRVWKHERDDLERDFSTLEEYYAEVEMLMKQYKMKFDHLEKERANILEKLESRSMEVELLGEIKEELEDEILLKEDFECLDHDLTSVMFSKSVDIPSVADNASEEAYGSKAKGSRVEEALNIAEDIEYLQSDYGDIMSTHISELEDELDGIKLKNEELEEMNGKLSELFNNIC